MLSLAQKINLNMFNEDKFTFKDVYNSLPGEKKESIRARVYENLGKYFERLSRGVYRVIKNNNECLVIEGDGRDLSMIEDSSIDAIITDHPWLDKKANKGGNRNFTENYECFKYTLEDFNEKYRVLKEGSFLVEILPAENESNYEYLYEIKQLAKQAGFSYYSKIPWKKGVFCGNTGRKKKNTEDIMFFTKGKARNLRLDVKKTKKTGLKTYMSGTNKMLPSDFKTLEVTQEKLDNDFFYFLEETFKLSDVLEFDIQAVPKKEKIHKSEKPLELILEILEYITKENETVLDQYAGSGVVGEACLLSNRSCILIEKLKENVEKIINRLFNISDNIQVLV